MPLVMMEPAGAARFAAGVGGADAVAHHFHHSSNLCLPRWKVFGKSNYGSFTRRENYGKNRVRASGEQSGLGSEPIGEKLKAHQYHPFEAITESALPESGDARLTPAEITKTVIEVNSKAAVMFVSLATDEISENIFWTGLHYVTDEYGNIYFKVKSDEDIVHSLTSENNAVQVLIGLDDTELSGSSQTDFGIEEFGTEDSIFDEEDDEEGSEEDESEDGDHEEEWVSILDDVEEDDDSDEIGDWAKLETMQFSHPIHFASQLAEVAAGDSIDWMDQPPAGLVIHGLLSPAFVEECSGTHKNIADQLTDGDAKKLGRNMDEKVDDTSIVNGHGSKHRFVKDSSAQSRNSESDEDLRNETSFYKLEMTNVQLISAHGHQTTVQIEDLREASPDAIAHSAAKIISSLKAGGEKTNQAFKALCWRCKGIQVEEATIIGIDTLGFDLKVCSGVQVQTLRFAFSTRATSEYSAERQLNDMLFPRIHHKAARGGTSWPTKC